MGSRIHENDLCAHGTPANVQDPPNLQTMVSMAKFFRLLFFPVSIWLYSLNPHMHAQRGGLVSIFFRKVVGVLSCVVLAFWL